MSSFRQIKQVSSEIDSKTGWLAWYSRLDDENHGWARSAVHSFGVRLARMDPWNHMLVGHCYHHDLVGLRGRRIQAQPSGRLRH